ncbi:MAG: hypothetical protein ACI97A_004301, partial [Planctomycetota bacterium]
MLILALSAFCAGSLSAQLTTTDPKKKDVKATTAFSAAELEQLVAPIALYPDELSIQVLMASTYPLEVVQAGRFVKQNPNLTGEKLDAELKKKEWDESVKSLANFPVVLGRMNDKLDWVQKLGDAVIAQESDVLSAIQRLRKRADKAGNLKSSKEQTIIIENETIVIESAQPEVIYVPSYNPTVVYGAWPYAAYPPGYYYPRAYYPAGGAAWGFATGVAIGAAWHYAWGGCNWGHGGHGWNHGGNHCDINVNRNRNVNRNSNRNSNRNRGTGNRGTGNRGSGNRGNL